jgi:hypothetical protein
MHVPARQLRSAATELHFDIDYSIFTTSAINENITTSWTTSPGLDVVPLIKKIMRWRA